jgi:hypothetical protein
MRTRIMLMLCVALALTVGVATANAGGGNSGNAKLCQNGGWQHLYRSDGSSFASEEDCVSYGAHGGTLTQKTKSQLDCESFGGTFAVGTDPVLSTCQWANTGQADYGPKNNTLIDDCFALLNQFPGSGGYEYNSGSEPVIPGVNTGKCFHF